MDHEPTLKSQRSISSFHSTLQWPGETGTHPYDDDNDGWRLTGEVDDQESSQDAPHDNYPIAIRRYLDTNDRLSCAAFDQVLAEQVDDPIESINGERYVSHHVFVEMLRQHQKLMAELIEQLADSRREAEALRSRIDQLETRPPEYGMSSHSRGPDTSRRSSRFLSVSPTKIPQPILPETASARSYQNQASSNGREYVRRNSAPIQSRVETTFLPPPSGSQPAPSSRITITKWSTPNPAKDRRSSYETSVTISGPGLDFDFP